MDEAALVVDVLPVEEDGLETLAPDLVDAPGLLVTDDLLWVLPTLMPPRNVPPVVLTVLLDEELLPVETEFLLSVCALRPWYTWSLCPPPTMCEGL